MSGKTILLVGCVGLAAICVWSPGKLRASGAESKASADLAELSEQIEDFYAALENGRAEEAEELGNRLVGDPERISLLFGPIADGSVAQDRLSHWVGVIDICTASYIMAPDASGATESEREGFLRRALDSIYSLPPDLAHDLLARRSQYGGFEPDDASALAELLGLPGCFDAALSSLQTLKDAGVLVINERDASQLREAAQNMSAARDYVRCASVLGLLLSRGVPLDLELLDRALLDAQDAHARGLLLRSVLMFPDVEIGWSRLSSIAESIEGPFDGFAVSRLPVVISGVWREFAGDHCLSVTSPRSRLLLVDILRDDPEMLGLLVEADEEAQVVSRAIRLLGSTSSGLERLIGSLAVRLCPVTGVDGDKVPTEVLHAALFTLEQAASRFEAGPYLEALRVAAGCLALHAASGFTRAEDRERVNLLVRATAQTGTAPRQHELLGSESEVEVGK